MKSSENNRIEIPHPTAVGVTTTHALEPVLEMEPLFLESLVAEANRILDGLNAVRCRVVEEGQGHPSIQVSCRDNRVVIGGISGGEMHRLASKVRKLRELLYGAT
ncbi:MAG: hypothetical protein HQL98_03995 [Magnetococcales bacterium]|nr:hypothetical protein [Magnetococcales bacterium]